ncbi:MAG: HAMP domain-containing sensor histidine kinase [Candidatus Omnitrophica bacterium]|nr:HAMP domain-containing sensor histidine kinase [Candidatus Omnitrophota bacterium]
MKGLTTHLDKKSGFFFTLLGVFSIIFVSLIDYITKDFFVLGFYIIPVIIVTWFTGRKIGIFMAFIGSAAAIILNTIESPGALTIHGLNFLMEFGLFLIIVYFISIFKQALEAQSNFISIVSHELRTPLVVIKENISALLEGLFGEINERQKNALAVMLTDARRLTRLIDDMLEVQKIESGRISFIFKENDMAEAIQEAHSGLGIIMKEKGLNFTLNAPDHLPKIKFDKDRIAQVVTNLLSNAIKFTDKGGIIIDITNDMDSIRVAVRDTGRGMKPDKIRRLFRKFGRTESHNGSSNGMGLGLVISKDIITAHGGKIWAESEFDKGSTFYFTIPLNPKFP